MPTYGYRCGSCGSEFDVWQRMTEKPVAACPVCGNPARRLFFPAGIVFRGTGFYKTDSRKAPSDGASSTRTTTTGGSSGEKPPSSTTSSASEGG